MDPAAVPPGRGEPGLHPRQPVRPGRAATAAPGCHRPGQRSGRSARPLHASRDQRRRRWCYVFGSGAGPRATTTDKMFGFLPGNGVHDIHMNQGNSARFPRDDGVWQDGGLLLHLPSEAAVGQRSSSPSRARPGTPTTPPATPSTAVPRPATGPATEPAAHRSPRWSTRVGPAPEAETVTLLNASPTRSTWPGGASPTTLLANCYMPVTCGNVALHASHGVNSYGRGASWR